MFIRDPWTMLVDHVAGSWNTLGSTDITVTDVALFRQLHAVALALVQAQQDILAAQQRNDVRYVQLRLQDVTRLRDLFKTLAEKYSGSDVDDLSALEKFLLAVGTWVEQAVRAAPGLIAAVPNAVTDAIGRIAFRAGVNAGMGLLPVFGIALAALWLLGQAERRPTFRAVTRRALRA